MQHAVLTQPPDSRPCQRVASGPSQHKAHASRIRLHNLLTISGARARREAGRHEHGLSRQKDACRPAAPGGFAGRSERPEMQASAAQAAGGPWDRLRHRCESQAAAAQRRRHFSSVSLGAAAPDPCRMGPASHTACGLPTELSNFQGKHESACLCARLPASCCRTILVCRPCPQFHLAPCRLLRVC